MSLKSELVAAVYSLLSGDSTLTASSGITPPGGPGTPGAVRSVAVVGQVDPGRALPYVRIDVTGSKPISDEPFDFGQCQTQEVEIWLKVFSDWEPEARSVAERLEVLLQNRQITTTHFRGSSWWLDTSFATDNLTDPDRLIRMADVRIGFRMEAA